MNKRLRKKKHLGEFRELGCHVCIRLDPTLSQEARNQLIASWVEEAIEAQGLLFGGGGARDWEGYVTPEARGSVTEAHRQTIASWLSARQGIAGYTVYPLSDAWYGHGHLDPDDPATLKR